MESILELNVFSFISFVLGFFLFGPLLFTCFVMVRERTFKTTVWLGSRYYRTLEPGFHVKWPWPLESVDVTVPTKIRQLPVSTTSISLDRAQVQLKVNVQYVPLEGKYYEAAYVLEDHEAQIRSYIDNILRAEITKHTVDSIFAETKRYEAIIEESLTEQFQKYGYRICNVLVDQPFVSEDLVRAFERKLVAERQQQAAEAEGEAIRIKMTKEATAEGESLTIKAEAFKKMRGLIAEGNGEALRVFMDDLQDGSIKERDVLDFFSNLDMREAVRDASARGGQIVFVAGNSGGNNEMRDLIAAVKAGSNGTVANSGE